MKSSIFKATLIIERFGGIDGAKRYLERKGNFLSLSGVTKDLDLEIRTLIQAGKRDKGPVSATQVLDPNSSYCIELVREYEKLKITCSTRTINILELLEIGSDYASGFSAKVSYLSTHFFQPYNFSSINNSGKKTIDEIHNISKALHIFYEQVKEESKADPDRQKGQESGLEKVNLGTVKEYQILKSKCGVRTINILEHLEEEEGFLSSDSAQISFVEKLFFSTLNYKSLKNAGVKTVDELTGIRHALWKFVTDSSLPKILENPFISLNSLEKYLNHSFPNTDLESIKTESHFSLQRVFCALFTDVKLARKIGVALNYYLFESSALSYHQLAEKAGCTRERVRQILNKFNDSTLPGLVNSLRAYKDYLVVENVVPENPQSILEINPIHDFEFNGKNFSSNFRRDKIVLTCFLKDSHLFINDLPVIHDLENSVFDVRDRFYFLNIELANEVRIDELMNFLQEQIFEFESVQFDYNLRILIERFYKESGHMLATEIIDVLFPFIQKIKAKDILVDERKLHRLEKSQRTDEIKSLVENLLRGSRSGIRTQTIMEYLNKHHIEIGIQQLLSLLGRATQQFARLGHGAWVLKEWLPPNEMKGSVREIVEGLLNDSEKPLHISELLAFFKTFRPLSENSLRTNLKVSENIHFTFFNCGFIGLKSKKYDNSWYSIPSFNPRKFTLILNNKSLNYSEKIDSLVNIGFPRVHCEYLVRNREEKGK